MPCGQVPLVETLLSLSLAFGSRKSGPVPVLVMQQVEAGHMLLGSFFMGRQEGAPD